MLERATENERANEKTATKATKRPPSKKGAAAEEATPTAKKKMMQMPELKFPF